MQKKHNIKHYSQQELKTFLNDKSSFEVAQIRSVKDHLDVCKECWDIWNIVRWDKAKGSLGLRELQDYLGDKFIEYFDSSWALAHEWNSKDRSTPESIQDFYMNTSGYLYNSLIFFESGDRLSMQKDMELILERHKIESVLDYGSGVGTDALTFMEKGIKTFFADFDCPASDFLKHRIKQRGYEDISAFIDVTKEYKPSVDMIWTIDTLEHMVNPYDVLNYVSDQTRIFAYFIDDDSLAGGRHPFHKEFNYSAFNEKLVELGFKRDDSINLSSWSRMWSR